MKLVITLTEARERLIKPEDTLGKTSSEVNIILYYRIRMIARPWLLNARGGNPGLSAKLYKPQFDVPEDVSAAVKASYVQLLSDILEEERKRSRSVFNRLKDEYFTTGGTVCDDEDSGDVYLLPTPFINELRYDLRLQDRVNSDIPDCQHLVVDMTGYSGNDSHLYNARWPIPHKYTKMFIISTRNVKSLPALLDDMKDLTSIYEVGTYLIYEYSKEAKDGHGIELYYAEKDYLCEIAAPKSLWLKRPRPRFYFLANKGCDGIENDVFVHKETILVAPSEPYAFIKYGEGPAKAPECKWDERRSYTDKSLTNIINRYDVALGPAVTGPVIIVDMKSLTAFPYFEPSIPFLLDDRMIALELHDNYMEECRHNRTDAMTTALTKNEKAEIYKKQAVKISKRFPEIIRSIETDSKLAFKGQRYHLSDDENEYLLFHRWADMKRRATVCVRDNNEFGYSKGMNDLICGNKDALHKYLQAFAAAGFIEKNKGTDGVYTLVRGKCRKQDAVLFAILVSCKLGMWMTRQNKQADEREDDEKTEIKFDENSEVFVVKNLCGSVFAHYLSLNPDIFRKNKSITIRAFDIDRSMKLKDGVYNKRERFKNVLDVINSVNV